MIGISPGDRIFDDLVLVLADELHLMRNGMP